jgi:predicted Rossmann fold nucleotide-binding protein DprA/Smf involved in DNA uptake
MVNPTVFTHTDPAYPVRLQERLGRQAPTKLIALGNVALLSQRKTALFCSVRCPGDALLGAYDTARKLREEGVTVISGFHSPVEKECLRTLLRGKQPIIICAARAIDKIRLPSDWRSALEADRLLILSPFPKRPRRPTVESARQRGS